jgi:hypothetical protein
MSSASHSPPLMSGVHGTIAAAFNRQAPAVAFNAVCQLISCAPVPECASVGAGFKARTCQNG